MGPEPAAERSCRPVRRVALADPDRGRRRRRHPARRAVDRRRRHLLGRGPPGRGRPARPRPARRRRLDRGADPGAVQRPLAGPRVRRRLVRRGRRHRRLLRLRRRAAVPARSGRRGGRADHAGRAVALRRPPARPRPAPLLRRPRGPHRRGRGDSTRSSTVPLDGGDAAGPRQGLRLRRRAAPVARRRRGSPGSSGTTRTCPGTRRGCGSPRSSPTGRSARPILAAGGPDESIVQPEWAPDGTLHLISDRTGWWNLYRLVDGPRLEPLAPMEAEFADPPWIFGRSSYGFLPDGAIVAVARSGGRDHLYRIEPGASVGEVDSPFTELEWLRVGAHARRRAGRSAPGDPCVVARFDPVTLAPAGVLRRASIVTFDPAIIAEPESIEFPTTGDRTAHALYYPPTNPDFRGPDGEKPPLVVLSHGGPTVERLHRARPREAVPDQPRHRGRRRRLRREHRLRPRVPPAPRRAVGRRRRRRLRRRGAVPRRARRRRPGPAGHRGRQRRRLHDARGPCLP